MSNYKFFKTNGMFFKWNTELKNIMEQTPKTPTDMTKIAPILLKSSKLICFEKIAIVTPIA